MIEKILYIMLDYIYNNKNVYMIIFSFYIINKR